MNSFPQTWKDRDSGETFSRAHEWHYYPEQGGTPLGAVVRFEREGRKLVVPFFAKDDQGRPKAKAPDEPRPLFGLNTLDRPGPILVCEGEKDAAALQGIGFAAVTSQGGGKAARKADWEPLRRALEAERQVLVWPDHDEPGRSYAATVANLIGDECQCLLEQPEGTPATEGAGAADWLSERMREFGHDWNGLLPPPLTEQERQGLRARLVASVADIQGQAPEDWGGETGAKEPATYREIGEPKPYVMNERGTFRLTRSPGGDPIEQQLANFAARIVEEVTRDDGEERALTIAITGTMAGRDLPAISLTIEQFNRMDWPARHWGTAALTHPGQGAKDHLKYAIQLLSHQGAEQVRSRTTYTHTGWRRIDGAWVYLSAGAVIGPDGVVPGIEVDLGELAELYRLPEPSADEARRREAAEASYRVHRVAPPEVAVPLLACTYLAPMAQPLGVDFAVWLEGPSRSMKSTLAAIMGAHFGAGMERTRLAASWLDTANAIGLKLFLLADALAILDDYAPQPSASDQAKLDKTVATVIRSIGNRTGRGRLTADIRLQAERKPRAMALCTAEQWPGGESINARVIGVTMRPGILDLEHLNQTQADARAGLLARSLADCVCVMADGFEDRCAALRAEWQAWRTAGLEYGLSGRTPEQVAYLLIGYGIAVEHWIGAGVLTRDQGHEQIGNAKRILFDLAKDHERRIANSQPADAFVSILTDLLLSGGAHLRDLFDSRPEQQAQAFGWRGDEPGGVHIGWVNPAKQELYLLPTTTLEAVYSAAKRIDTPLNLRPTALKRQLWDRGFLLGGNAEQRDARSVDRTTRVVRIATNPRRVLVMPLGLIEQREDADQG
ncbi:toprim domain-containing protein [Imhoffiella purpurea]|uniref:DUF927 domain-containing protein n=1 Tax=Imhoffiella purpurea TaxID=1249627 RepID=W9VVV8_9GAMM|nr:toprim domain-containing protein [Imhoffiella purpurea]EXJ14595.1 hypothetical protein D779_2289 [Imhoffiella purpurea]